jgi:hypothetical protein
VQLKLSMEDMFLHSILRSLKFGAVMESLVMAVSV